jgi:hypothetical protein
MKIMKRIVWITPLALLIAGCASQPTANQTVSQDPQIAEWERDQMLPWVAEWQSDGQSDRTLSPTGPETSRVYPERSTYSASEPSIIVVSGQTRNAAVDLALADTIRRDVEYDRGLAPSLQRVVIEVRDGGVILRGSVKSDMDARVIVDNLRDVDGVARVTNDLVINSSVD